MKEIYLNGKNGLGKTTIVSDKDFEELNKYKWYFCKDPKTKALGYVFRYVPQKKKDIGVCWPDRIQMHRQIIGDKKGYYVDHINRNTLDNRRENLRHLTPKESVRNRDLSYRNCNNGFGKGYTIRKRGNNIYYQVQIYKKYIGICKTESEAIEMIDNHRKRMI